MNLNRISQIEISYRNKIPNDKRMCITSSNDAFKVLLSSWDENKIELVEQFKILIVDQKNNCLGVADISTGGVSGCMADPRIIFSIALKAKASGIILSHNHPSGNLQPSDSDMAITEKLRQGGKLLDISILDHLIITSQGYFSFAEKGIMPG